MSQYTFLCPSNFELFECIAYSKYKQKNILIKKTETISQSAKLVPQNRGEEHDHWGNGKLIWHPGPHKV